MTHVELGDEVQDLVSGVKGIAIGRTTWLTGCDHIQIKPQGATSEGLPRDNFSADEPMVKVLKRGKVAVPAFRLAQTRPGGPALGRVGKPY